jgi:sigma-E factor negative regulatory protein RseA
MSERMRESLSALLDDEANELEFERILANISDDSELRQTWVRYNMVRGVSSGHALGHSGLDISGQVRAAITEQQAPGFGGALRQRVLRPVASLAVAASVAATVVIGGQQLAQVGTDADNQAVASSVSPVGMLNSLGATPMRASYGTQAVPVLQPATHTAYRELARQRMQVYMQEHAEHASLNSPQGLIPFARVPKIQE